MLHVYQLSLGYGDVTIVRDACLQLERGEIGCLLGPSGCGKTTLLRSIAGFERARTGHIRVGQRLLADADRGVHVPTQRRDVGMVFQDHALFPHLRVGDNVGFGLHGHGETARQSRVQEMLELVGLDGMARRWPHELSGGQQQRVALARALAPAPEVLLLDEPFSSLDTAMRESLAHEVRTILKRSQTTALMVTHDQSEAFAMADRIGVMTAGRLLQWDRAHAIYTRPATREVAEFVGEGSFLNAEHHPEGWRCALGLLAPDHPHYLREDMPADGPVHAQGCAQVLLRPEQLCVRAGNGGCADTAHVGAGAYVQHSVFRGSHLAHTLRLDDGQTLLAHSALAQEYVLGQRVWVELV